MPTPEEDGHLAARAPVPAGTRLSPTSSAPALDSSFTFIAYKSEDRERAARIVEGLRSSGITVWWDQVIDVEDWNDELKQRLKRARCAVVVWSELSVGPDGDFVRAEAREAFKRRVYVGATIDAVELPLPFGERQNWDLTNWDGDPGDERFVKFVNAVRHTLALEPVRPPPMRRFLASRYRRMIVGGITLGLAVWGGVVGWTKYVKSREVRRFLAVVDSSGSASDRARAIDSLRARREGTDAEAATIHQGIVMFLARQLRRAYPLHACDSVQTRNFSDSMANVRARPDIHLAFQLLREKRRATRSVIPLHLDSVNLQAADLDSADLRQVSFNGACLDSASFKDAWLQGATFAASAEGHRTVFMRAKLDSARFETSSFVEATFYAACLPKTEFAGARLESPDFSRATLQWANFLGATIAVPDGWATSNADVAHALFVGAHGLSADDTAWLGRQNAWVTGMTFGTWKPARDTAAIIRVLPACRPLDASTTK